MLRDGARQGRRELVETAGWLYLLLSALHGDLDQREAAWTTRDVGYRLGLELGHGELIGWSYETASWLSVMDDLWGDVLEAAEEGVRAAPFVGEGPEHAEGRPCTGGPAPADPVGTGAGRGG